MISNPRNICSYYHPYFKKHDCSISTDDNLENTFPRIIFFYLVLLFSSIFAELPLPEGYRIINVTDYGDGKTNESRGNPHAPLLDATLLCCSETHVTLLWRSYGLWGTRSYGVSEKSIKFACANANAWMTEWKFRSCNTTLCDDDADGSQECTENLPVLHATVNLRRTLDLKPSIKCRNVDCAKCSRWPSCSSAVSSSELLTLNYKKLDGAYSRRWKYMVDGEMTNGTHKKVGNLTKAYPPHAICSRAFASGLVSDGLMCCCCRCSAHLVAWSQGDCWSGLMITASLFRNVDRNLPAG